MWSRLARRCEGVGGNDDAAFENTTCGADHAGALDAAVRLEHKIDLDAAARMLDRHRRHRLGLRDGVRDRARQAARHRDAQPAGHRMTAVAAVRHQIA